MAQAIVPLIIGVYVLGYLVSATLLARYAFADMDGKVDWMGVAAAQWAAFWPVAAPFVLPALLVYWLAKKLE